MKVLIVDDETLARDRLRRMVEENPDYEVCADASNGQEALQRCEECHPDVVLMDIRMPGMDGMEAARHLAAMDTPPAVIFATAYGDHALEAFETHAADYLLKPIRPERLADALARAKSLTRSQMESLNDAIEGAPRSHISARDRGNLHLVPVADIRYFRADQKYVSVRFPAGEVLVDEALKSLEEEFSECFMRIHRNALVAVRHIAGLEKDGDGHFKLFFTGVDDRLEVSRRHVSEVRRALKAL